MPEQNPAGRPKTKKIITILRFAAAPLLLLIILLRVDVVEIASAFRHIRFLPFIAAVILVTANFSLLILKWRYLLSGSVKVSRAQLIRSVIGGYAFVLATPGQVGEFSRVLFIPGQSKLKLMGLVAIDKASAFGATVLLSSLSLALWHSGVFYMLFIGILGLFILIACRPELLTTTAKKLSRSLPFKDKVSLFLEGFGSLSHRRITTLLFFSLFYFMIYSTQFYLLLWAFENVDLRVMVICFPLVMLINSLPITMGGLGVREGAAVLFFSQFGVQESSALAASLLLFTINILIPGLCGLAFIHHIGAKPKPLPE